MRWLMLFFSFQRLAVWFKWHKFQPYVFFFTTYILCLVRVWIRGPLHWFCNPQVRKRWCRLMQGTVKTQCPQFFISFYLQISQNFYYTIVEGTVIIHRGLHFCHVFFHHRTRACILGRWTLLSRPSIATDARRFAVRCHLRNGVLAGDNLMVWGNGWRVDLATLCIQNLCSSHSVFMEEQYFLDMFLVGRTRRRLPDS